MNFNEKMFAKMREASQKLVNVGPTAATAAIRQALQQSGLAAGPAATRDSRNASKSPPMRDINPIPGKESIEASDTVVDIDDAVAVPDAHGFISELFSGLGMPVEFQGGKFFMPEFQMPVHMPHFSPPSFASPDPSRQETDADGDSPGRFIAGSYTNQAGTRTYKLYVPSSYRDQALPLMVMLHGCTQDPDDFAFGTRMNAIAEEKQCFVVYPAQTQCANSSKCWNWFNAFDQQRNQGEPSIIAGITRQIIDTYHIDAGQIYVAGMSAGGAMAVIMGTLYPDLYVAVGVHSGLPYASAHDLPSALAAMKDGAGGKSTLNEAAPGATARLKAIPIIVFHGDRDTTVHPRNGEKVMAQNGRRQGTESTHGERGTSVRRGKVPNGHSYTQTTHQNAQGEVVAEHWLIHGAAHAWSGGSKRGTYTDAKGPDAAQEMMRFFYTQKKR
jgi:poly(hydroxyalkanoate) depolymerase family esterase